MTTRKQDWKPTLRLTPRMLSALRLVADSRQCVVRVSPNVFLEDAIPSRTAASLERHGLIGRTWTGQSAGTVHITRKGLELLASLSQDPEEDADSWEDEELQAREGLES